MNKSILCQLIDQLEIYVGIINDRPGYILEYGFGEKSDIKEN